jgi:hypothetical protein
MGVLPIAYIRFLVMGIIKLEGFVDDWARDIDRKRINNGICIPTRWIDDDLLMIIN